MSHVDGRCGRAARADDRQRPCRGGTSGKNVSFGFSDTEGTATFEVQIDGLGFLSSTSPMAYNNLSDGSHTFQVRARRLRQRVERHVAHVDGRRGRAAGSRASTAARPQRAPPARTSASASPTRKAPRRSKSRSTAAATRAPRRRRPTPTSPTARTPSTSARWTPTATRARPSRTWTVDAVAPPVPSIDSGPAAASTSARTSASASPTRKAPQRSKSDRRRRLHRLHHAEGLHQPRRRLAHLRRPRARRLREHVVGDHAHVDGGRGRAAGPSIDSGPAAASTSGKNVSFGFSDTEGTATFEVQIDGGGLP